MVYNHGKIENISKLANKTQKRNYKLNDKRLIVFIMEKENIMEVNVIIFQRFFKLYTKNLIKTTRKCSNIFRNSSAKLQK